jgi:hypothetical protein
MHYLKIAVIHIFFLPLSVNNIHGGLIILQQTNYAYMYILSVVCFCVAYSAQLSLFLSVGPSVSVPPAVPPPQGNAKNTNIFCILLAAVKITKL